MDRKIIASEKGVALILILWVVILLSVIANAFAWMVRTEAQAVGNFQDETRAYYLARSGFQQTILNLLESQGEITKEPVEGGPKLDGRINTINFQDGYAEVKVMDESGKMDVNVAGREDIIRILTGIGLEDIDNKDIIADSILDWIDENNLHRVNGAEDDYYRLLPQPYGAKDAPLSIIDELLWVRGITPKIFYNSEEKGKLWIGLEGVFTVFTGSNKVNINTAPLPILLSIPGIDEVKAERIIAIREESPFRDMNDLSGAVVLPPEFGKFISFSTSGIYTIEVAGKLNGSHVRRSFKSAVKIKGKTDYEILYWKEG